MISFFVRKSIVMLWKLEDKKEVVYQNNPLFSMEEIKLAETDVFPNFAFI